MYLRKVLGEEGIIVNPDVFDPDYIPEELPFREGEMEFVAREMAYFLRHGVPSHLFLWGPPGTGKTASIKKLLREASTIFPAKTVYVNAWSHRTRLSILSEIARQLGILVPIKGVSADDVFSKIEESLRENRVIVALDEVDRLVDRQDVLYDLSRLGKNLMLITISNGREFLTLLDRRIASTLFQRDVRYPPYTVPQLAEILRRRAEIGLKPGSYDEEILRACAAVGYSRGGDARVAIHCLLSSAKNAETEGRDRITLDDVRKARDSLVIRRDLDPHLEEIIRILRERGELTTRELYEEFSRSFPVTMRSLRNYIRELERLGIIETRRAQVRGNVRVVRLKE